MTSSYCMIHHVYNNNYQLSSVIPQFLNLFIRQVSLMLLSVIKQCRMYQTIRKFGDTKTTSVATILQPLLFLWPNALIAGEQQAPR